MKRIATALAVIITTTAVAQTPDPRLAAQESARAHREAQRIHVHWYRGFVGDGVNQCVDTGGMWPPTQDLVREGFIVHLVGAAQLAPGHYLEVYTDGASTTLIYATTRYACQQILDGMIESRAKTR